MRGRRWSDNEIFKVMQLVAMGYGIQDVSTMMNRTYAATNKIMCNIRRGIYKIEW